MKFCDFETIDTTFCAMKRKVGLYTDDLGRVDLMIQLIALVLSPKINSSSFTRPVSSHSMSESHSVIATPRNSKTLFSISLPCANNTGFSLRLQPLPPWVNPSNPKGRESENHMRVGLRSTSPFIEMPWCAYSSSTSQSIASSISSFDIRNGCSILFSFIEVRQSQKRDRK